MIPLKEEPDTILARAEELGCAAFGPVVLAFFAWLVASAKERDVKRLYFLAREGYFLLDLFKKFLSLGFAGDSDFDSRYLLISRRAVFGAWQRSRISLKAILDCGEYEGSLHDLLEARIGVPPSFSVSAGIPNISCDLPRNTSDVLDAILPAPPRLNELAAIERAPLIAYLTQEGLFDSSPVGLVDVGYSANIQRALFDIAGRDLVGFYFATTTSPAAWKTDKNEVIACFASDCSLTKMPPVFRYALALESWLTAPDGQVVRFQGTSPARAEFASPGQMQQHFQIPQAIARGVERYLIESAFLAPFDRNWQRNVFSSSQDIFATALESRVFEDVFRSLSVEDLFCGHGEMSIYDRIRELTSDVRLQDVQGDHS